MLRRRGLLVDARPDSRVRAHIEHLGARVATIRTQRLELSDDVASDHAIAAVKRAHLFRRVRADRFWHRLPFDDRVAFEAYIRDHLRFVHRPDWTAAWRAHAREWRKDPLVVIRAVRYEVLEAL